MGTKKIGNYSPPNSLKGEKREGGDIGDTAMTPAWDKNPCTPFSSTDLRITYFF
jgi:hypothetical protein